MNSHLELIAELLVIAVVLGGSFFFLKAREFGMLVALAMIYLALRFSNPAVINCDNIFNVTRQMAMFGVLAIGSAFVIITGGIDLSVGSLVGLTGVILAWISSTAEGGHGHPLWIGISVSLAVAIMVGVIQGLLITRMDLQPFIVTLGMMLLLRGVSQTIVQGGNISFAQFGDFANVSILNLHRDAARGLPGDPTLPLMLLIMVIVAVVCGYLLHFTVFGRYIFAIGGNRDAAQFSGIPVKNVEMMTYVISAGLAGVAGICFASYNGQQDQNVGVAYELQAIASCVLGGCSLRGGEGTVIGVIIGTALLKVIDNGLNMFQILYKNAKGRTVAWKPDDNWKFIVIGAVILVAVILDQVVHFMQKRRRTRAAGLAATQPPLPPSSAPGGLTVAAVE